MWPFGTIKSLRLELIQANGANDNLRERLKRSLDREAQLIEQKNVFEKRMKQELITLENELRALNGRLLAEKHAAETLVSERDQAHGERDAAVINAQRFEELANRFEWEADDHRRAANALRSKLKGAMVRDSKTGRMVKWVDPESPREQQITAMSNTAFKSFDPLGASDA